MSLAGDLVHQDAIGLEPGPQVQLAIRALGVETDHIWAAVMHRPMSGVCLEAFLPLVVAKVPVSGLGFQGHGHEMARAL
eukprot:1504276-Lingulodinium_polyedra.AAC.1